MLQTVMNSGWAVLALAAVAFVAIVAALTSRRQTALSPRRKVALSLWQGPREAYIHTKLTVDVEEALAYLEWLRGRTGQRVTITHLVGKAIGRALTEVPELNRTLAFNGFFPHESADVSFLIALERGDDTGWVKIRGIEGKTVQDIAKELTEAGLRKRRGKDDGREALFIRALPVFLLRPLLALAGWLAAGVGLDLSVFGVEPHPFGRVVIINSASFGAEEVYVSRTAFAHVAMNIVICQTRERPVVVDGEVVARKSVNLCANADHRYLDGAHLGRALTIVRRVIEDPWNLEAPEDRPKDKKAAK